MNHSSINSRKYTELLMSYYYSEVLSMVARDQSFYPLKYYSNILRLMEKCIKESIDKFCLVVFIWHLDNLIGLQLKLQFIAC